MQVHNKTKDIILARPEIALLLAGTGTDEKRPALCGAYVMIKGHQLVVYASNGENCVRGRCKIETDWEAASFLFPRSALSIAKSNLGKAQEAHFRIGPKGNIAEFRVHGTDDDGVDVKGQRVELPEDIALDVQTLFPFKEADLGFEPVPPGKQGSGSIPTSCFPLLKAMAQACEASTLDLRFPDAGTGLPIQASAPGGTSWSATLKGTLTPTAPKDDNKNPDGSLKLTPTPKPRRGRPKGTLPASRIPKAKGRGKA
jgi:hypothetical protein